MTQEKTKLKIEGLKVQMSQIFSPDGRVVPVTMLSTQQDLTEDLNEKDIVIVGKSKGKGFTGVMKKWNFAGQMATRGQSDSPRAAGSIGGQTPGRVLPGKKMAGRHGNKRVTIKSSRIVKVDVENKRLFVSGPVPGARNAKVVLEISE